MKIDKIKDKDLDYLPSTVTFGVRVNLGNYQHKDMSVTLSNSENTRYSAEELMREARRVCATQMLEGKEKEKENENNGK